MKTPFTDKCVHALENAGYRVSYYAAPTGFVVSILRDDKSYYSSTQWGKTLEGAFWNVCQSVRVNPDSAMPFTVR